MAHHSGAPGTRMAHSLMAPEDGLTVASAGPLPLPGHTHCTLPHDSVPLIKQAVLVLGRLGHSADQAAEGRHTLPEALNTLQA